ncbi:4-carboxymuconolactone decarboxylase [Pseudorhodobacter ferrugineus]|uniref:4-carboxymuconolactone decarboxylase n=1 Tax=Pseudorhodobacter ferrugineus TaxID=77008 RepID=UPI0003B5E25C|nr:4-carboxymuconolactone decarboxylase [Pseudorhodobacter ferrugineus]
MSDLRQTGIKTRRRVLGDAHVDRAQAGQTPFDAPFQALLTDTAWGHVWSRDTISLRERSMMTIAILAATGNDHELALHLRATANTGASENDIIEAILHVGVYAGIPRANTAMRIAKEVLAERSTD